MDLRIEMVRSPQRLENIAAEWEALRQRSGAAVFQGPGWILAWWRSRSPGDRSRLCVGLGWMENELLIVMPFVTRWHRGVRVLEWAAKECSDYCDAVVHPELAGSGAAVAAVWTAVSRSSGFDLAYLSHVRPDAAVRRLFEAGSGRVGFRQNRRSDKSLQVIRAGTTGTGWFRGLTKKNRNNHTRGKRILGEVGEVAVRQYGPADEWQPVLDRMIALKRQWLAQTGQENPLLSRDAATLRALADELARQGSLRLFCLECGGALAAASLNILAEGRMQAFFAAYDPEFERASPGTLIMVDYLIWAFDNGITEVDFLCGEEDYKYKFVNAHQDLGSYVGARTLIGRIALAVDDRREVLGRIRAAISSRGKLDPNAMVPAK